MCGAAGLAWGAEGLPPAGSRRDSDPKRERGWFLVVSPRQHQVHVSPPGTALADLGASPFHRLKSPGGHVLASGLRVLGARCQPPCVGIFCPPRGREQHTALGEALPFSLFYLKNTAEAIEGISFVRSGDPSLPLVRPGEPARRWQEVTHAGRRWHWRCKVALKIQQLVRLMRSPVGLYRRLVRVNVCPAGSYSMISMIMYDP